MSSPLPVGRASRVVRNKLGFEFAKIGASRYDLSDPYHAALTVGWPTFGVIVILFYSVTAALFAGLYLARPDAIAGARPGALADAFFFSIETLATVGYGEMAPGSIYGHVISSIEIVTGVGFTAIMTGLIFVRFSRAKAKLVYADVLVITNHNGKLNLMVRVGNARMTMLTDVKAELHVLAREVTREGTGFRRIHDLPLARSSMPIFPFILTLMHEIDESSMLFGMDIDAMVAADLTFIVSLDARDPDLFATVHDMKTYVPADIRRGVRFVDTVSRHRDGHTIADLTRISMVEPDDQPRSPAPPF